MSKEKFYKNGKLDDDSILQALAQSIAQYENGEILEVRDTLFYIVEAIDEFDRDN